MKALIRNEGETVTEDMGIKGIDWKTGYPLTGPAWFGGPYKLVENYVEEAETVTYDEIVIEEPVMETVEEEPKAEEAEPEATVVIDGKTYTVSQLRQLLGE